MSFNRLALALVALLAASLLLAPTAAAHKTVYSEDGKIKIVWGFLNEPAVTWTKTGLDLILSDNETGAPIEGASETLEAHLKWGDDEIHFENLRAQHGQKGRYTDVVTLTKPGIYTLNLHGTINGTAIDMDIPSAHEIHGVDETFFPAASDPYAMGAEIESLKTRIAALEAKAQTQSTTPATLTPQPTANPTNDAPIGAFVVALGIVAAALILRRRA